MSSAYGRTVFRPNLVGTAYERHQARVRDRVEVYGKETQAVTGPRRNDFDVLKERHKFIREQEESGEASSSSKLSWEESLAAKYEASLYKEFAVCDLKHYKSGNVALRWRTEDEVVSGAGQDSCGNTRCAYHTPRSDRSLPPLSTLEVPFAYVEHGERKSALVKLVLCDRCTKKLMYKRNKEKEEAEKLIGAAVGGVSGSLNAEDEEEEDEEDGEDGQGHDALRRYVDDGEESSRRARRPDAGGSSSRTSHVKQTHSRRSRSPPRTQRRRSASPAPRHRRAV